MKTLNLFGWTILVLILMWTTGCKNCCHTSPPPQVGPGSPLPPGVTPVQFPTGGAPVPMAGPPPGPPPGGSPFAPPPPQPIPGGAGQMPPPPAPIGTSQIRSPSQNSSPLPEANWRAAPPMIVQLSPPEQIGADHVVGKAPMQTADRALANQVKTPMETAKNRPMPVGIPQFALVTGKVATGLRPMLDDGLDWLQAQGYRTVVHLRTAGEADSADRKQIENRGMKYVCLELTPASMTRAQVQDFLRMVSDPQAQPLFVYDRDGALAGSLWYAYFKQVEQNDDETSRVRAGSLGLRENVPGLPRDMYVAVRQTMN